MIKSDKAVERRTVLLAGGAAATAVLSGCVVQRADPPVITQTAPPAPAPTASATQPGTTAPTQSEQPQQPAQKPLAQVADIPAGGGVILKDQNVVLTKDQSGKVCAFSAICTHQGCTVTAVEGGTINCPCHGSKFRINDGCVARGPANKPLAKVDVQIDGDTVRLV